MDPVTRLSPEVARLVRRTAFGVRHGDLATLAGLTPAEVVERLLAHGGTDPWGDTSYAVGPDAARTERRRAAAGALQAWLDAVTRSAFAFDDWLTWVWHGHFVSALPQARDPQFMVDQWRLFRNARSGSFAELARAVTVDPAMLLYLDGNRSTGAAPNENYSRELLELFTLGIGNYTEDDVAAGARALSGWRLRVGSTAAEFVPRRHDDTPQRYLGVDGVHDVDTVVAAIDAHPALAGSITGVLAREIVGPAVDAATLDAATRAFRDTGGSIDAVVRSLLMAVAEGADGGPIVAGPFPWVVAALRATGVQGSVRDLVTPLLAAGQLPWFPPNVSGWPSGAAWSNAATVVARLQIATGIVAATAADHPTLTAGSSDELSALLGLPQPFGDATRAAIESVDDARARLVLALTSPDVVLV
ncbi:MAG: DUF1800 family protein [Acidimicrobiales bacterium]